MDKQGLFLFIHVHVSEATSTVQRGLDINKVCKSCELFVGSVGSIS